jgi:hypothetical protein
MPTAEDLRAERARRRVPVYRIAAVLGWHPNKLSGYLNATTPLDPDNAQRILRAIAEARPAERLPR